MRARALWIATLAVFWICAWSLPLLVEPWRDVAVESELIAAAERWQWARPAPSGDASPRWLMARSVDIDPEADQLRLELCPASSYERWNLDILLVSAQSELLDFNRHHRFRALKSRGAPDCVTDGFTRLAGDGRAFVLLATDESLGAQTPLSLVLRQKAETPGWAGLRVVMLGTGLLLLVGLFSTYAPCRPRWLLACGLAGVAAIAFGCCISVSLKADIYALLMRDGGPGVAATLQALLSKPIPEAGFGIFTELHAILFFGTTLVLALLRRSAALDLFVLAVTTETLQMFVPGRGPGISDVGVDLFGVGTAYLLLFALWRSERVRLFLQQQAIDENTAGF